MPLPRPFRVGARPVVIAIATAIAAGVLTGVAAGAVAGPSSRSYSQSDFACPEAESVRVEASIELESERGALLAPATVEVTAEGLVPADSPYATYDEASSAGLVDCLVGSASAGIDRYSWIDGRGVFLLDTAAQVNFGVSREFALAGLDMSREPTVLWVDLCRDGGGVRVRDGLVCSSAASGELEVLVEGGVGGNGSFDSLRTTPAPTSMDRREPGVVSYSWAYRKGPAPAVEVSFDSPWHTRLATWLDSSQGRNVRLGERDWRGYDVTLNVGHLAYLASALTMLATAMAVLNTRRARRLLAALALAGVSFGAIGFSWTTGPRGLWDAAEALPALLTWVAVAALATKRPSSTILLTLPFLITAGAGGAAWVARGVMGEPSDASPFGAQIALAVGLMGVTLLGAGSVGRQGLATLRLLPRGSRDGPPAEPPRALLSDSGGSVRRVLAVVLASASAFAGSFALAFPFGAAGRGGDMDGRLLREVISASESLASLIVALIPLVVIALAALALTDELNDSESVGPSDTGLWALALALAASLSFLSSSPAAYGVVLPLWLSTFFIVGVAFVRRRRAVVGSGASRGGVAAGAVEVDASRSHEGGSRRRAWLLDEALGWETRRYDVAELDKKVDGVSTTMAEVARARASFQRSFPGDPARDFFANGPGGSWRRNAERSALLGAYLGAVPVAYFVWNAVAVIGDRVDWSTGPLFVLFAISIEGARWLVVSYGFGALYRYLPGRVGPVKALVFSSLLLVGVAGAELSRRALGLGSVDLWGYRSLQLVVFLVVLAIAYDLASVHAAGGGWRQLRELYALRSYTDLTSSILPVVLAMIALGQQVATGSGLDLAESFVSGVGAVFGR